MVAKKTTAFLQSAGIKLSYSRPRVSDDNPFIESLFKTIKYDPTYPGMFDSKTHACEWLQQFVARYHKKPHKGLNGYTPIDVFRGLWPSILRRRQAALEDRWLKNPERFTKKPIAKPVPNIVSINILKNAVKPIETWENPDENFVSTLI